MVQLEVTWCWQVYRLVKSFNSYMVQLEEEEVGVELLEKKGFNSYMVQLEELPWDERVAPKKSFNSYMVQLEVSSELVHSLAG